MDGVLTSSRSSRLLLAVAVVLSGLAVAARVVTSRVAVRTVPAGLAAVDAPGPDARPMSRWVDHPGGAGSAAFRLKAPAGAVVTPSKDDPLLLTVRIARGTSVLVARFPGDDPDARAGVERVREGISGGTGDRANVGRTRPRRWAASTRTPPT